MLALGPDPNEDRGHPEARRVRGTFTHPSVLVEHGYQLDVRALYRGDLVPSHLGQDELLVVMGGPMGVADLDNPQLPYLKREVELLRSCIEQDQPVLGVCLGSQLLAHAAGARVHQMHDGRGRQYEVGWGAVRFRHETGDAVLRGLPLEGHVLHWHGDTFELPAGAALGLERALRQSGVPARTPIRAAISL